MLQEMKDSLRAAKTKIWKKVGLFQKLKKEIYSENNLFLQYPEHKPPRRYMFHIKSIDKNNNTFNSQHISN